MSENPQEILRPVLGFESSHLVSNTGNVYSKDRVVMRVNGVPLTVRGIKLKPLMQRDGRHCVDLKYQGRRKMSRIHRLVAEAFIPNPSGLPEVNHIDGNPRNNIASNLEWCSKLHNMQHAATNKLTAFGDRSGRRKLNGSQVSLIRKMLLEGYTQTRIASMFGCSSSNISVISSNKSWVHQDSRVPPL